jgi:hypothetical protein
LRNFDRPYGTARTLFADCPRVPSARTDSTLGYSRSVPPGRKASESSFYCFIALKLQVRSHLFEMLQYEESDFTETLASYVSFEISLDDPALAGFDEVDEQGYVVAGEIAHFFEGLCGVELGR